jgi:hypothetical protein
MRGARDAECDERPQRHSASSVSGLHIQMCSCTCRVITCPPVCRVVGAALRYQASNCLVPPAAGGWPWHQSHGSPKSYAVPP